jgi:serine/threonine-protein kinase HipA
VERYDRHHNDNGSVSRLHQEDICQALHIPPEQKYENEGGPTILQCFNLLDQHIHEGRMAGVNRMILLQGVIFNFIIGNGSAHGKNFSILFRGEGEVLASFYDLLCILVYDNAYNNKMAMKLGGNYMFNDVALCHFERLGETAGFKQSFINSQIKKMIKSIQKNTKLVDELYGKPKLSSLIYDQIAEIIEANCLKIM